MARAELKTLTNCRVLVVEDEYFLADDMAHALKLLGAEVLGPAASPDQALQWLDAGRVDAAVLDINLRGEAVFALAATLRARGVPFVFATGYDESSIPDTYRDVPRWEKPFDPHQLARALTEIVHAPERPNAGAAPRP